MHFTGTKSSSSTLFGNIFLFITHLKILIAKMLAKQFRSFHDLNCLAISHSECLKACSSMASWSRSRFTTLRFFSIMGWQ